MKILHSSDWHLGRSLYGRSRHREHAQFLDWLLKLLKDEAVEVLLISGDVFDTTTPSNRAQELYYGFLPRALAGGCRHIIICAGNHDSPTFLAAPQALLKGLNIHVVSSGEDPAAELIPIHGQDGRLQLLVCAVPYLRDRDVRTAQAGENFQEKESRLLGGIREHYEQIHKLASSQKKDNPQAIVISMGHLFTAGGTTVEGDGVRDLYVGSLAHVAADIFPDWLDYVALGHLHRPQTVGGCDSVRYCGSPLAMGFAECGQQKVVNLLDAQAGSCAVRSIPVPVFQNLQRIADTAAAMPERLRRLAEVSGESSLWLELHCSGSEAAGVLKERCLEAVAGSGLDILLIRNDGSGPDGALSESSASLDSLDEFQVFGQLLDVKNIEESERQTLLSRYRHLVAQLAEADIQSGAEQP